MKLASTLLSLPARSIQMSVGAVDHDLGEVRVAQERLDRAVAEDVVGDLLGDPGAVRRGEQDVLVLHGLLEGAAHHALELGLGQVGVVQLGTELLEQPVVHLALRPLKSSSRGLPCPVGGRSPGGTASVVRWCAGAVAGRRGEAVGETAHGYLPVPAEEARLARVVGSDSRDAAEVVAPLSAFCSRLASGRSPG